MFDAEPYVSTPVHAATPTQSAASDRQDAVSKRRVPSRYVPERGLVRRLRAAQANDGIGGLTERHSFDSETRDTLSAELIKAGAPPITPQTAEKALSRLVTFEPLNVDALRPFLLLSADRTIRAHALAQVAEAMNAAGRSVRLVSDATDSQTNDILTEAGKKLSCAVTKFDGTPDCVSVLRKADLASLSVIEAGFRAPLDKIALLRLSTLVQATGAEPIVVIRPEDASLATTLSKIGVKRVILVQTTSPVVLGPVFTALREANLALAEVLDMRNAAPKLRRADAASLAEMLTGTQPQA